MVAAAPKPVKAAPAAPAQSAKPAKEEEPPVSPTPRKSVIGSDERATPPFIPWPRKLELKTGQMRLSQARIVAGGNYGAVALGTVSLLQAATGRDDASALPKMSVTDIPGHSASLNRSDPDFWMIRGTKPYEHHGSINFARDEVVHACETNNF